MNRGRVRAHLVEFIRQGNRSGRRGSIVDEHVRAGRVQRARDFGADAARPAGDQHDLIAQRGIFECMDAMPGNDTRKTLSGVK